MSQNKTIVRKTSLGTTRVVKPYQRHNRATWEVEYEELTVMDDDLVVVNWRELLTEANADNPNPPTPEEIRADLYVQQQLAYNALVDVNTLPLHQLAWCMVAAEQAAEFAAEQRDRALLMTLPF